MRCFICDRALLEGEIKFNKDHQEFDPCGVCLDVISEVFEPLSEEETTDLVLNEDRTEVIVEDIKDEDREDFA